MAGAGSPALSRQLRAAPSPAGAEFLPPGAGRGRSQCALLLLALLGRAPKAPTEGGQRSNPRSQHKHRRAAVPRSPAALLAVVLRTRSTTDAGCPQSPPRPSEMGAAQGRPVRRRGERPGAGAAPRDAAPKAAALPLCSHREEPRDGSWRGVCTRQMETGAARSHRSSLAPAALLHVLSKFRWRLKFLTRGFKSFSSPAKRGLNSLQLFPGARWGTHVCAAGARAAGRRAARESTGCGTASARTAGTRRWHRARLPPH